MDLERQSWLSVSSCPNAYNTSGALVILIVWYYIAFGIGLQFLLKTLKRPHPRRDLARLLFHSTITFFTFSKAFLFSVPLPWNTFSCLFFNDQVPRFLFVVAWLALSMWISTALLPPAKGRCRSDLILLIFFSVLLAIFFVVSLVLTIVSLNNTTLMEHNISLILSPVLYFTVVICISITTYQLVRLLCFGQSLGRFKGRIRALIVFSVLILLIFLLRFLYSLLRLTNTNRISAYLYSAFQRCFSSPDPSQRSKGCAGFSWLFTLLQVLWEGLPTLFILLCSSILSSKPKKHNRSRQPHSTSSHSENSADSRSSSAGVYSVNSTDLRGRTRETDPLLSS
ncbi:hypothetical protein BLNAU_17271 [Blattamonas nauphoetae]|uniref:G-protein coupled receptors family 1 profile domain-containing protein n=1 Tax=Blattamonas nauphoetae TaxID=2049346 RepID=A0ABQ9X7K0_9EUKA|nr:hypothetical protein BLNAU_17271 [Blattamonas nauphoetae]